MGLSRKAACESIPDGQGKEKEMKTRMKTGKTTYGHLAAIVSFALGILSAPVGASAAKPEKSGALTWIDIGGADVEGRGWKDTELPFDRIPKRFAESLPKVFRLGTSSTGEFFEFESDTTTVAVRTEFESRSFGERNFNSCAFAGTDLYAFDSNRGEWRWVAAAGHNVRWSKSTEYRLVENLSRQTRRFRLYLPLRNRLTSLRIGIDAASKTKLIPPRKDKPVAYYGTSIIHGAYTIRPGVALTSRLERKVKRPFINLGVSGGARLEPDAAKMLAELDAAVYVCDPYHNLTPLQINRNFEAFFDTLCSLRPDTPVLLVGAPPVLNGWIRPEVARNDAEKTRLFAELSKKVSARHGNFHYLPGQNLYGSEEVSMDGVHPNDEAFANMAEILAPIIMKLADGR